MKLLKVQFLILLFIISGCSNSNTYKQNESITFEYKKVKLLTTISESSILAGKNWLNGKPASRLTIIFKVKNNDDRSIELKPEDFKVRSSKEDNYITGDLLRPLDDFTDEEIDRIYDTQKFIVMPHKEANFNYIYWLPYASSEDYFKDITWDLVESKDHEFSVQLKPTYEKN